MTFIRTIPPADADGPAAEMYRQVQEQFGSVPNWAKAFSLRPGVKNGWTTLLSSITANLPQRTYELATLAAARALKSSYCSLAHGRVLATQVFDAAAVTAIMTNSSAAPIEPRERAMMAFAEKVAVNADRMTREDVDALRSHGYSDAEIFDIAAAAAARCFFSRLLDALGVQADASFNGLDPDLRAVLTIGRPIAEP
jgi:uncharacterized peroxidase-related enzyme